MTHSTENDPMPVHFCNILHALRMYDRFENTFLRWSISKQRDRQQLVLTLAENATISQGIVSTITLMYPRRIAGPFISKNTFTIEFLDDTTKYDDTSAVDMQGLLVGGRTTAKRKRQSDTPLDHITGITRDMHEHLNVLNPSEVAITNTTTGEDSDGQWVCFEISEASRINVCFLCNVYTAEYSEAIKVCCVCVYALCPCICARVCIHSHFPSHTHTAFVHQDKPRAGGRMQTLPGRRAPRGLGVGCRANVQVLGGVYCHSDVEGVRH